MTAGTRAGSRGAYIVPMKCENAYTQTQARAFCSRWLPAWTGNEPEHLAGFYTDDLFYSDPTVPQGLNGKPAFLRYITKLLGDNPKWIWRHESSVPLEDGFLNHWRAELPVGWDTIVCRGVCSVQLRDGLIFRNQVFFDTSPLLASHLRLECEQTGLRGARTPSLPHLSSTRARFDHLERRLVARAAEGVCAPKLLAPSR